MNENAYVLGHSPEEAGRIIRQAEVLRPITRRLLRCADIERGMHVLDVGCGPGDVTFLVAEMVGPTGRVTGIDPSGDAIGIARRRAEVVGFSNTEFSCSDIESYSPTAQFDAVICRYVLIHQTDPVRFIKAAAQRVRGGGVLALHEMDVSRGLHASPPFPLLDQAAQWAISALAHAGVVTDAGGRLVELFNDAKLPTPLLFSETIVESASDGIVCSWITAIVRSLLPVLRGARLVPVELDIDEFEEVLNAKAAASPIQVEFVPQMCAWVRL